MSFGKSSNKSSAQQNINTTQSMTQNEAQQAAGDQSQAAISSSTPNNLPLVQEGWASALANLFGSQPASNGVTANGLSNINSAGNATTNAALAALQATGNIAASGAPNAANPALQGLDTTNAANGALGSLDTHNSADPYLAAFTASQMTAPDNPYFANLTKQIAQSAQQATDGDFAASGRYGSGANANAFNGAVANTTGQLGYQNYTDSLNRALSAAGQLSTNSTNSTAQKLAALQQIATNSTASTAQKLAALQQLSSNSNSSTNSVLAALGLAPSLGQAATGAGAAQIAAGNSPSLTFAQILQMLGAGGTTDAGASYGNTNEASSGQATGQSTGNQNGTSSGSSTTTGFSIAPKFSLGPFSFG